MSVNISIIKINWISESIFCCKRHIQNDRLIIFSTIVIFRPSTMRREYSSRPYTHARRNWLLFAKRQRGSLDCVWGVQTHNGPPVFLVLFRKDLARMNGTPQPNQKWLPAQGIERGSLNPKPQPLTSGRFLTPKFITCCSNKRDVTSYQSQKHSHNRLPHLAAHLEFNTLSSQVSQVQRD